MSEQIIKILNGYGYVYLQGVWGTILLSVITVFFATIFGSVIALIKMSKNKIATFLVNIYVEVIRGTPILLQLYFFWLLLPKILPIDMSDIACVIVALIVNASAYVAEVIRAGIQSVDKGQIEAAMSLGMSKKNMMMKIIMPQAVKIILPAMGNEFIGMIKMTSLASVFFVSELTTSFKTVQSATFLAIPSITIAGIIYLSLTFSMTRLLAILERKLNKNEGTTRTTKQKRNIKNYRAKKIF